MRKFVLSLAVLLSGTSMVFGQGANNIKINEVMTNNTENYLDEYGNHLPWVELVNNSFTTYNIRGMYITTNHAVLDEKMSVPERMKLMSIIPNGFAASTLTGRSHLLLFLNSLPEKGARHLSAAVQPGQGLWIALYDGNAKTLIDSVTVKPLGENQSYARLPEDGIGEWNVAQAEKVTPECNNQTESGLSNIAKWKQKDPHGYLLSIQAMSITFIALILLFIFMKIFGKITGRLQGKKKDAASTLTQQTTTTTEKSASKTNEKEIEMAVIAMALDEYENDIHDNESGVITIQKKQTTWNSKQILWQNKIQRQTRR